MIRILLLIFSVSALASDDVMDVKTAIEKGLAFSPDVQKAQSQVAQANATFRLAEAKIFPTINLQGITTTNRTAIAFDPINGASSISGIYNDVYTMQMVVTQPIYQGGALEAGLSAGKVQQEIAEQTYFKAKQDFLQSLLNAYLTASQNEQQLAMATMNRDVLKGFLTVTTKYTQIGRGRTIDRLQAQANYQMSEAEILRLTAAVEQSIQDLLKLMGDTKLAHSKLESHFEIQPVATGTLEEAFSRALQNNPDIRLQHLQIELQRHQNDIASAPDWPSLALNGTFGYNSPDRDQMWDESSKFYTVGLTLTVPLFTGLSSFAQRRVNRELLTQAEKTSVTQELTVKESLAVAMATLQRNFQELKFYRQGAESAREAMTEGLKEFARGLVTSTDIITIQTTRYTAETQFLTAQFSYLIQILNLRHDLGADLEKIYAAK